MVARDKRLSIGNLAARAFNPERAHETVRICSDRTRTIRVGADSIRFVRLNARRVSEGRFGRGGQY